MSSIAISPQVRLERSVPAGAVRLTRRGRIVLMALFLAAALGLMVAFGGFATATHDHGTAPEVKVVTVQPGDTLYDLAATVAGPGEIRDVVHQIRELNSIGGSLEVGQRIAVPLG